MLVNFLQCTCVCVCVQSLKLCLTFCDPTDHNTPSSLSMRFPRQEYWSGFATPSSRGSSQPRDRFRISCIAGKFFTCWAIRETPQCTFRPLKRAIYSKIPNLLRLRNCFSLDKCITYPRIEWNWRLRFWTI